MKSLEDFSIDKKQAVHAENSEVVRTNRALRAELEKTRDTLKKVEKKLGVYELLDTSTIEPAKWLTPTKLEKRVAIPTLMFTDVHWDEVVSAEQIGFVNKYDRTIAMMRVQRAFSRSIRVARDYLSGVSYDGFNLLLGGDLLSGVIHDELVETNEATIIESILSILDPLISGIRLLEDEYGRVNVAAVVGNHGRREQRWKAKNKVQDNFDWLVYKLLQRELAARKNIVFNVPAGPDAHVQLYNVKYLLTHGDQFKGGSGISAALAPLLLGTHRKTRKQAVAGRPYDVMVMGHFHTSIWMPTKGLIVGGSVCGYNEFADQQNLEPEEAQCAFWLTTPERGITVSAPVYVADRVAEGW